MNRIKKHKRIALARKRKFDKGAEYNAPVKVSRRLIGSWGIKLTKESWDKLATGVYMTADDAIQLANEISHEYPYEWRFFEIDCNNDVYVIKEPMFVPKHLRTPA